MAKGKKHYSKHPHNTASTINEDAILDEPVVEPVKKIQTLDVVSYDEGKDVLGDKTVNLAAILDMDEPEDIVEEVIPNVEDVVEQIVNTTEDTILEEDIVEETPSEEGVEETPIEEVAVETFSEQVEEPFAQFEEIVEQYDDEVKEAEPEVEALAFVEPVVEREVETIEEVKDNPSFETETIEMSTIEELDEVESLKQQVSELVTDESVPFAVVEETVSEPVKEESLEVKEEVMETKKSKKAKKTKEVDTEPKKKKKRSFAWIFELFFLIAQLALYGVVVYGGYDGFMEIAIFAAAIFMAIINLFIIFNSN